MPQQLLDCHYIHSSIEQPGGERVTQRMPRNTLNPGLSARQGKARLQIHERFPSFQVVENELVFPPECPELQDPPCFPVVTKLAQSEQKMGARRKSQLNPFAT
jgi:hypothetical protein